MVKVAGVALFVAVLTLGLVGCDKEELPDDPGALAAALDPAHQTNQPVDLAKRDARIIEKLASSTSMTLTSEPTTDPPGLTVRLHFSWTDSKTSAVRSGEFTKQILSTHPAFTSYQSASGQEVHFSSINPFEKKLMSGTDIQYMNGLFFLKPVPPKPSTD
jgi:hypothetical protein